MQRKLRVLQVNKYDWTVIGGVESHLGDIVKGLGDKVEMTVLVCNEIPTTLTSTTSEVKEVSTSEVDKVKIYKIASLGKLFSMPISLSYPFWFLKLAKQTDIIHFHHPFPLGEVSFLIFRFLLPFTHPRGVRSATSGVRIGQKAINNKPTAIVTWHSDIYKQKLLLFFYKPFLRRFLQAVDKIIVTSPNMAKNSLFLKNFQDKIEVVPLGIDPIKFALTPSTSEESKPTSEVSNTVNSGKIYKIRKRYAANNKPLLLSVGRLVYYKGYEYLLRAMREVDANLLIIGCGPLLKNFQFSIFNSQLNEKIHIINPVSDNNLINFYHACDIFVLPSVAKSEAFAIVQLEAMICSKPVINTNLPTGVPWVSLHNQTGLTVEPKNPQQLAKAINKLISNKELRIQLGQKARKRVLQYFTHEKMLDRLLKIYSSLD